MRRILLLNPNTNKAMTAAMRAQAATHLPPEAELTTVTGSFGFPVVATRVAYAVASHAALDAYARRESDPDVVLLSCFGDPGLEALRELAPCPVVGLAEASIRAADRFAAVHRHPRDRILQLVDGFGIVGARYEVGVDVVGRPALPSDIAAKRGAHRHVAGKDEDVLQRDRRLSLAALHNRRRRNHHLLRHVAGAAGRGDRHAQYYQPRCWHLSEPRPWQTT